MKKLHIMNTREVKDVLEKLESYYGCDIMDMRSEYGFLIDQDDHIFLVSRDIEKIDLAKLRINSVGMYFAEINKYKEIRLTIEASQLIGPKAAKNVFDINSEDLKEYFKGKEIAIGEEYGNTMLLIRSGKDFFGAAKCKDGTLLNYLPKVHRTKEIIL